MGSKKRALISVSNRRGVVDFAERLSKAGFEIVSTGGTGRALREGGVSVTEVSDLTGFPEMMGGRVKTLHPKIHGGLLALRDDSTHQAEAGKSGIGMIDLLVVNLYPFKETVAKNGVTLEEAIENIDIGGPAMIRSGAKNYRHVTVVVDPADYDKIAAEIEENGISQTTREQLAVKAFRHTADYDSAIETFLVDRLTGERIRRVRYEGGKPLRYGENVHQEAFLYRSAGGEGVAGAVQLHGKEMSYNNYLDAQAAVEAVRDIADKPAAVVAKHGNPCGLATGPDLATVLEKAWNGDRESAMGSVIAVSRRMDRKAAEFLRTPYRSPLIEGERRRFIEIVAAPGFDKDALDLLRRKSKDLRLLEISPFDASEPTPVLYRQVSGGLLEQSRDDVLFERWEQVTRTSFPESKRGLGEFAMKAAKHTKSNAIVLAREYVPGEYQVIGMGAGQPNRVDSLRKLSITKARENLECEFAELSVGGDLEAYIQEQISEVVLASDALIPFDDTIKIAHELGIRFIVQPGGSVMTVPGGGDKAVIETADRLGIGMIFTGTRHFLH